MVWGLILITIIIFENYLLGVVCMNKNIGLIGLGNMGSMILNQFLNLKLIKEGDVYISNRSKDKVYNFEKIHPKINVCDSNLELASKCDRIIICVEPSSVPGVLLEIKHFLNEEKYLMISTSTVAYEDLYKIYKGKITKFMPTLNSVVRGGITLVCHNEFVNISDKNFFEGLFSQISEVNVIKEEDMKLCHNLTGSLPAIISEIMLEFVKVAIKHSISVTDEQIEHMTMVSLEGASKLFIEKNMKFEDTISRVSTKGGITYEGIKIYQRLLPSVFEEAFDVTINKYANITENVSNLINELIK